MNDPNQPPSSRDPRPLPSSDEIPTKEVAKGAALGCLAGFGAVGVVLITATLVVTAIVAVGMFLLYLSCSGH